MNESIDAHSHFIPRSMLEFLEKKGAQCDSPIIRDEEGQLFVVTPERPYGPIAPGFYDMGVRREFLEKNHIRRQVIAPPPFVFYYWIDSQRAYEPIRIENDAIAEVCAADPDTYLGIGTVPLQDTPLAVKECERIAQLGLRGVEMGSNINGLDLDSEKLLPFFEAAEGLNLAILIHPNNGVGRDRLGNHHLRNLIGFPTDTTIAAAKLIFGGVLDRFPRLKICLGQGGGFLPYIIGRFDHGYQVRSECRQYNAKPPSAYLRSFYYDTLIFAPKPLTLIVTSVGADRVMLGADFPFDMGAAAPLAVLQTDPALSKEDMAMITGGTVTAFLGIAPADTRAATAA